MDAKTAQLLTIDHGLVSVIIEDTRSGGYIAHMDDSQPNVKGGNIRGRGDSMRDAVENLLAQIAYCNPDIVLALSDVEAFYTGFRPDGAPLPVDLEPVALPVETDGGNVVEAYHLMRVPHTRQGALIVVDRGERTKIGRYVVGRLYRWGPKWDREWVGGQYCNDLGAALDKAEDLALAFC